ncbi:MAG: ribonuclease M5 [Firmicutes bacterium]|nr:ribonuclease M5 [Bacillota bacterium]
MEKNKIRETIVVEGRDDTAAIRRSVDALTIETHGYGIRPETWDLISEAHARTGIIVFTDPDHAGEQIRRRILARFPDAKEAFLDVQSAEKGGDIGVENASPESIGEALAKAHCTNAAGRETFTMRDMQVWGLTGTGGAARRRQQLGKALGIGCANSKTFLARLNKFGITREQIDGALFTGNDPGHPAEI